MSDVSVNTSRNLGNFFVLVHHKKLSAGHIYFTMACALPSVRPSRVQIEEMLGKLNRDVLLQMLRREEELRFSDETQQLYDKYPDDVPPFSIEENIQRQVLQEFGFEPNDIWLRLYQYTNGRFPTDVELRNTAVYMRCDRSRPTDAKIGDPLRPATLRSLDGSVCQLSDFIKPGRPLVVIAGSQS